MIKRVKIGNKSYTLKANADTPRVYRDMFGRDIFIDIDTVIEEYGSTDKSEEIPDAVRIAFIMAYQAGAPASLLTEWIKSVNGEIPVTDFTLAVMELWRCNLTTISTKTDNVGDDSGTADTAPLTTAKYLHNCIAVGIGLRDLEMLTIGMVVDIFRERNRDAEERSAIAATQSDFDAF